LEELFRVSFGICRELTKKSLRFIAAKLKEMGSKQKAVIIFCPIELEHKTLCDCTGDMKFKRFDMRSFQIFPRIDQKFNLKTKLIAKIETNEKRKKEEYEHELFVIFVTCFE